MKCNLIFIVLFLLLLNSSTIYSDVELSYNFSKVSAWYKSTLKWKNRQTKYYWANNVLPVVAVGYTVGTPLYVEPGRRHYQILSEDSDGLRQYRYLYPRGERSSIYPGEEDTYGGPNNIQVMMESTLDPNCPYPRYPHIVLKDIPWYGLKTMGNNYAPPLTSDDISSSTGMVKGQSDYYAPSAWKERDAAFLVKDHHPTQLWFGMPHVTKNDICEDAKDPANYFAGANSIALGNIQSTRGSYIAPHNPSGAGVSYNHTNGRAPGGLMMIMAQSWGQEFFGIDMRVPFVMACKETWAGIFWDDSHAGFPEWGDAATDPNYGGGSCNVDPYQITSPFNIQIAYQSLPDYLPHNISIQEYYPAVNWPGAMKTNIVNATMTFYTSMLTGFYGYYSISRAHRLDDFADNAADDYARLRISAFAWNQGKNRAEIARMRYNDSRNRMLTEKNLSNSDQMIGHVGYAPKVVDLVKRMGVEKNVYDWGITWGDIEDFLADMRKYHYANGFPSNTTWKEMKDDLKKAFDKMKGKAPTDNLKDDEISYRYNWLTMIRIMKSYLPEGMSIPRGSSFFSAKSPGNYVNYLGAYYPQFHIAGSDIDFESQGPFPDTNWAAEIYWVEPRHDLPTTGQGFPVIDKNFMNSDPFTITADVLDDKVGTGKMEVRYAVSPGDPSNGGQSFWRDGVRTGGAPKSPVPSDWVEMKDIGASQSPQGGRRYSAVFDPAGIINEVRRIYIEARDNSGYRTISWVDVKFHDDGLPDLTVNADPPSGTHFKGDTTITLSTTPTDPSIKIYYTTDGTEPDKNNPAHEYSGPFTITADTTTVKALGTSSKFSDGKGTFIYYLDYDSAWIDADPGDGTTFKNEIEVELKSNTKEIYYTTDGSTPDPTNPNHLYKGKFKLSDPVNTVKGIAIGNGLYPAEGTWKYYKDTKKAWIDADPPSGTTFGEKLTISLTTNGDKIFYTTDGSSPDTTDVSQLYTGPFDITQDNVTVKGIAIGDGLEPGSDKFIYKRAYLPRVIAKPNSGTEFTEQLDVTLELKDASKWPKAKIYYTIDGSEPDESSTLYTKAIELTKSDTIIARAFDKNAMKSDTTFAEYFLVGKSSKAYYHDEDGDGKIDLATITLVKEVQTLPQNIRFYSPYSDEKSDADKIEWKSNSSKTKTIIASLKDEFSYSHRTDFSSGKLARFDSDEYSKEKFTVSDGVAPVIDSAFYCTGVIIDESSLTRDKDTLVVNYSEVSDYSNSKKPFHVITKDGKEYTITVGESQKNGDRVRYIVEDVDGVKRPEKGDRIWINSKYEVKDSKDNVQKVKNNRKAPLIIKPAPVFITFKGAPNPFSIDTDKVDKRWLKYTNFVTERNSSVTGIVMVINFHSDLSSVIDNVKCRIDIFDPLGNTVQSCSGVDDSNRNMRMGNFFKEGYSKIAVVWNGKNSSSRIVGKGTYSAVATVTLPSGETVTRMLLLSSRQE